MKYRIKETEGFFGKCWVIQEKISFFWLTLTRSVGLMNSGRTKLEFETKEDAEEYLKTRVI